MATHYLQQLSLHKLGNHQPNASLHSFVLVRNSLLHSILAQPQQDSWLEACFDELTPTCAMEDVPSSEAEDMEILPLEEEDDDDDDDDDDDEEEEGPISPDQIDFTYPSDDSPAFFMPIDKDSALYADSSPR